MFSKLDANSGFWQNKLSKQSALLITFIQEISITVQLSSIHRVLDPWMRILSIRHVNSVRSLRAVDTHCWNNSGADKIPKGNWLKQILLKGDHSQQREVCVFNKVCKIPGLLHWPRRHKARPREGTSNTRHERAQISKWAWMISRHLLSLEKVFTRSCRDNYSVTPQRFVQ